MLGTADVVDVWLLLEYRPVWKARAVEENDLSDSVRQWLGNGMAALRAAGLKVRPQMIRQPEVDRSDTRMLVHHEGVLREFGSGQAGYDDLMRTPIELLVGDSTLGAVIDAPRYFVCTNGQRDLCCARFGLPAYGRLRELVGERAWQTTHLGRPPLCTECARVAPGYVVRARNARRDGSVRCRGGKRRAARGEAPGPVPLSQAGSGCRGVCGPGRPSASRGARRRRPGRRILCARPRDAAGRHPQVSGAVPDACKLRGRGIKGGLPVRQDHGLNPPVARPA